VSRLTPGSGRDVLIRPRTGPKPAICRCPCPYPYSKSLFKDSKLTWEDVQAQLGESLQNMTVSSGLLMVHLNETLVRFNDRVEGMMGSLPTWGSFRREWQLELL
jgi:hypothetical protein